ncbi:MULTISPECIES: phosphorylase family protein [Microbacterium]|uniref:phosphorylase family protein n=1 Tax=Microbacterium TaxID=33882 RepID=UPI00217D5927|nr:MULTISPECIES: nucleoside phosphorylase [Microbacterium]UWF77808.1 nucleoside phosphorylase [Microbacterium neungamense]WCM55984.1 nucleoside phosphorylase [Microbacterium sp. EF45047]
MKLLVAALESELQAFPAEIPGFDRLVTGPGKLKAAYGLTRALDAGDYEEVLVVGTAGAVEEDLPADVYEVSAAIQHDVQDLDGIVGQHVSLPPRVETGREGLTIATGDIFVDDADAVARIRSLGGVLVDMETFAFVWVAQQFGVPIRVLRAVSDRAKDGATTIWDDMVAACSAQLWAYVKREYGLEDAPEVSNTRER